MLFSLIRIINYIIIQSYEKNNKYMGEYVTIKLVIHMIMCLEEMYDNT